MEVVGYKDTDWSGYYGTCMDGDCVYLAGPIHKQVRIIFPTIKYTLVQYKEYVVM